MGIQSLGLGLLFTAQDAASRTVVGLTANVRGLEGQASRTSSMLQTGLGGIAAAAVGAGLSKVVDSAAQFEFGLAKVKSIAMATAEDMAILRDAAFEAGLKTQFSPTQAVEGLQNLAAAGFSAVESARLLDKSLVLAQAGQISIAQATATVATSIKLFNLQGREQDVLVDKLLKSTNLFKIQAIDLEQGLAKTAAAALLTNQSVDEMLLTVGLIKNIFPDAGEAGNSISRAMQNLAQKADKVRKTFGVDVIDPETGGFKNALDLFVEIDDASAKMIPDVDKRAKELSKLLGSFGIKGYSAALASIDEFRTKHGLTRAEAVSQLRDAIAGAEGTAAEFLRNMNATFQGQRVILEGAIETLMVAVGEPLVRILQPAVERTAGFVSDLARTVRDMSPAVKEIAGRAALVASGVLAAGGAISLLRVGAALAVPILKSVAISLVGVVLAAAPMILVAGALGAAVMGLADAAGESGVGLGSLTSGLGDLKLALRGVVEVVKTGKIGERLSADLDDAGAGGLRSFLNGLISFRRGVLSFLAGIRSEFRDSAASLFESLRGLGSAFVDLGRALGLVAVQGEKASSGMPSSSLFNAGAIAARVFVVAVETLSRAFAAVVRFGAQVATGIRGVFGESAPVFEGFSRAMVTLAHNLGITASAFTEGGGEGKTFGENLGTAIGKVLILATRLATAMVEAVTYITAAFKAALPVIRPVFNFLADHIELIAGLIAGKFALSIGAGVVGKIGAFSGSLRGVVMYLRTGSFRNALGQFIVVPGWFRKIAETGTRASGVFTTMGRGLRTVATGAMSAVRWLATMTVRLATIIAQNVGAAFSAAGRGLRMIATGAMSAVRWLTAMTVRFATMIAQNVGAMLSATGQGLRLVASGAMSAVRWLSAMIVRFAAMIAQSVAAGIARIAAMIRGIGTASAASAVQVGGLGNQVGGLGGKAGMVGGKFAAWAGGIAAAGLAGWELGRALDNALGLSDKIGTAIANWTGESEEEKTKAAQKAESEENKALAQLKQSGLRQGRVVSASVVESLAAKEESVLRRARIPFKLKTRGAEQKYLSSFTAADLGLTPEEAAARTLLQSGLGRTEQLDALMQRGRAGASVAGEAIQRGVSSLPYFGERISAALASPPARSETEAIVEASRQQAAMVQDVATTANELLAAARQDRQRPVVLVANGREIARAVAQSQRDVDSDSFGDVGDTGFLD